jgi:hypothetical protein
MRIRVTCVSPPAERQNREAESTEAQTRGCIQIQSLQIPGPLQACPSLRPHSSKPVDHGLESRDEPCKVGFTITENTGCPLILNDSREHDLATFGSTPGTALSEFIGNVVVQ